MSNQDFIIPVVVGPLVGVVLYLLRRNVRAVAPVINEKRGLKYGTGFRVLMGLCWAGWLFMVWAALFLPMRPGDGKLAASVVMGALFFIAFLSGELFFVRVWYDETGITTRSPYRRTMFFPWSEITRFRFGHAQYVIEAPHGHFGCSVYMDGLRSLLDEAKTRGIPIVR